MASNTLENSDQEEEESSDALAEPVSKSDASKQMNSTHLSRSFYEMRPSRLSGASNASSLDSSHSSTASEESQIQQQQQQQKQRTKGSAIEILSSDEDEDNDGSDEESDSKNTIDSDSKLPQFKHLMPAAHARELKTLQFTLKNQEVKIIILLIIIAIFEKIYVTFSM